MKLQIFSDIHGDLRALERLVAVEADYYFAAGDLVSWGRGLDRVGPVMAHRKGKVYVMPGNHETAEDIEQFCAKYGFENFHGRSIEIGGWKIAGLGYSGPTPFNTPGEYTEAEIATRLAPFQEPKPLILICHAPPYGTALDRIREGVHGGSRSVLEFIEQRQPAHFFCGHIHEAEGVTMEIGATKATNVGKRGVLFELPGA